MTKNVKESSFFNCISIVDLRSESWQCTHCASVPVSELIFSWWGFYKIEELEFSLICGNEWISIDTDVTSLSIVHDKVCWTLFNILLRYELIQTFIIAGGYSGGFSWNTRWSERNFPIWLNAIVIISLRNNIKASISFLNIGSKGCLFISIFKCQVLTVAIFEKIKIRNRNVLYDGPDW